MSELPVTDRTRFGRKAQRGSYDRAVVHAILDEALVCHVGFVTPRGPCVIPTLHARVDDQLVIHGAVKNHMLGALVEGAELSIAVTLVDGLVLARTAFHHSMNYRSVVLFGRATEVTEPYAKLAALDALVDRAAPCRSAACRPANARELAATRVLAIPIVEASAKVRSGPPLPDEGEDAQLPYWAGVIPVHTTRGVPINAPDCAVSWPPPAS
ncbi:MAG TPA: pyridoxamine 5'-phosphate oxidase family protein [Kofleriaceae bacterium]|jgi:nitroimidazol reductase NimA-like FMN-containing flavoprotein (pyridoxamine 5'-phosphate oxidase superfamily)|nr:pyridoxamine 5'-phosphate oxidase family protein [Kofleriaceae bacterium]